MDTAASTNYQFGGYGNGAFGGGSGSSGSGSSGTGSSSSNGSTTQGYAIPINTALTIAKQIDSGQASSTVHIGATAFLGVQIQGSSQGQGFQQTTQGVAIVGTESGTAAASAGLGDGDVITSLGGKSVSTGTDIQDILVGHHPGDKVSIGWTDAEGQSHTATLTLGAGPAA